jgi:mRNA interferase MazF
MEELAVGDIVLVKFPFSDLKNQKQRPALIVASADFNDLIVCQITSKKFGASRTVTIAKQDLAAGLLPVVSYVRPDKLFTLDRKLVLAKIATLDRNSTRKVLVTLRLIFSES